ncbi:PadR family transcriptional regulator [Microlunatus parietis]|uniref:DNA-binding PadR family transcriptional regulator n=1 Tax=Microlunatus parietis TaxID=682979 RepID=A0A7Y9LCE3_9ACTN|nr:PadR family transcriptional regulator [Microlunatus parietis]NYE70816.1 DNA-binding PadR family transcriptional regulator [Microlunatus parietis]
MARQLTPLAVMLLALLAEREMHPYEMFQTLVERGEDRLVKVRPGSLYHTVERLAEAELIRATGIDRAGNRPERTRYALTEAGLRRLQARVTEMLRTPVNEYPQFLIALDEAHNLPREQVIDLLSEYAAALAAELAEVTESLDRAGVDAVPEVYWLSWKYLLHTKQAELDWVGSLIERIKSKDVEWPNYPIHDLRRQ